MISSFLKQKDTGKSWGTLIQVSQQGSVFITIINLVLLSATAYKTTISPWLQGNGIYISFIMFMLIMLILLSGVMILMYKFALPSYFSAFNDQFYKHDNLLRKDIEEIKKDNRELKEILSQLLKENGKSQ